MVLDCTVVAGCGQILLITNEGTSRGLRRPQSEADHSLQFSTEIKNGEAIFLLIYASLWPGA